MAKLQSGRYESFISIKYGWSAIACGISCIWDIKFKIYVVSKSVSAAKSQNIFDMSEAQKPTWAKFLEFNFFYLKKTRLYRYYQNKNQLRVTSSSYISLTMKLLIKS